MQSRMLISDPRESDSSCYFLSDRTSLPPSAAESHTHLAHAMVQYLGISSPVELTPYGLSSAGDLVDLISRVSVS